MTSPNSSDRRRLPRGITFLGTEQTDSGTYHVYRGPNQRSALNFLRDTPVKEELIYNIVETPQGNIGADLICLFNEADGSMIELVRRTASPAPVASSTRCAWCGYVVVPVKESFNDQMVGTVAFYGTYDEYRPLPKMGGGFTCRNCTLLQCAWCSGLTSSTWTPGPVQCRSCRQEMNIHRELHGGSLQPKPAAVSADGSQVTFPTQPAGDELWGRAPLTVPWHIDVREFLDRDSLPYLWPRDSSYMSYINGNEHTQSLLQASWINVFLHHPNPDVVLQCLRDAPPKGMLNYNALADLLVSQEHDSHIRETAAKTTWNCSETGIKWILNVLLDRGMTVSNYRTELVHQAIVALRSTCPPEKESWLDTQLADPKDD